MDSELNMGRLAVIREIADRLGDTGKTQLQKIVYFIQEAVEVPLGYSFRMHHYGPYSDDLDGDLSLTAAMGYVDINPDFQGYGYHITPTVTDTPIWPTSLAEHISDIRSTIDSLGSLETRRLELYATAHFVVQLDYTLSRDQVIETVRGLKPKFSKHAIKEAFDELQSEGLIQETISVADTE